MKNGKKSNAIKNLTIKILASAKQNITLHGVKILYDR